MVQRHQSPERPILRQISSLIYPKIQWRQVIMNVLHPSCERLPRWSPPVLWRRFEDGLASVCVLVHSCKMPKENETTGLNDGRKWWLVSNAMDVGISDKVVPANVQDCLSAPLVHLVLAKDKVTHCCYCCLWWWLCVCGLMHNTPLIQFLISVLYILFACLYCMLPHLSFFLTFSLLCPSLSFSLRINPLHFHLRNDLFCVDWDIKPQLSQSVSYMYVYRLSSDVTNWQISSQSRLLNRWHCLMLGSSRKLKYWSISVYF